MANFVLGYVAGMLVMFLVTFFGYNLAQRNNRNV